MTTTELQGMDPVRGHNFYQADPSFAALLDQCASSAERSPLEDQLLSFAEQVSNQWDAWAEAAALDPVGPQLQHYDRLGHPIDVVVLPHATQQLRRAVVEAGIFHNKSLVEQYAKVYLLAHLGEAGTVCPLACTEGLIRSIQAVGSDFLKAEYLPQLLSAKTPVAGAQFITEQDMGSDVGALKTVAVADGPGRWRLTGEKWFCSAITDFTLVAARPEGAAPNTKGVSVFFVPRIFEGKLNNLKIKRLKNKIGTKELPTAEIDLNGAIGFNIGPVEQGFKTLMNYVLNTSRIMNAASSLGLTARACLEAQSYTSQRSCFGEKIQTFPMVQASLRKIEALLAGRRALYFTMLSHLDQNPTGDFNSEEAMWQRFLINLCKYRTAIGATECTREAILLHGGNGTIETFSILPRLYRDSLVLETWEGTHNVLALQIARDSGRFDFAGRLTAYLKEYQNLLPHDHIKAWFEELSNEICEHIPDLLDAKWAAHNALLMMDRLGVLLEVLALAQVKEDVPKIQDFIRYAGTAILPFEAIN